MGCMLDYLLVDSYKATPIQCLIQCFCVYKIIFVPNLDWPSWTRVRGRLTKASDQPDQRVDQRDMDSQVVSIDQFVATMVSIQEAIAGLGQKIDRQ